MQAARHNTRIRAAARIAGTGFEGPWRLFPCFCSCRFQPMHLTAACTEARRFSPPCLASSSPSSRGSRLGTHTSRAWSIPAVPPVQLGIVTPRSLALLPACTVNTMPELFHPATYSLSHIHQQLHHGIHKQKPLNVMVYWETQNQTGALLCTWGRSFCLESLQTKGQGTETGCWDGVTQGSTSLPSLITRTLHCPSASHLLKHFFPGKICWRRTTSLGDILT